MLPITRLDKPAAKALRRGLLIQYDYSHSGYYTHLIFSWVISQINTDLCLHWANYLYRFVTELSTGHSQRSLRKDLYRSITKTLSHETQSPVSVATTSTR